MDDFTYDVMQKKRIAASARHRVNGSKSKFVGLPSDHMTPAQLKKLNGPCDTYNLGSPMTWEEFKSMPTDLQSEYLDCLTNRFGVSTQAISTDLFKLSTSGLPVYIKRMGINRNCAGGKLSCRGREIWDAWLNGQETVEEPVEEPIDPLEAFELMLPAEEPAPVVEDAPEEGLQVSELTATFTGNFEPEKFMRWMAMLPMPEGRVKIRVEVTKE